MRSVLNLEISPIAADADEALAGVKLWVASIAGTLGVSMREMAEAGQLNRMTLWRVVCENRWPEARDRAEIKLALYELLQQRGANAEQLQVLFEAQVQSRAAHSRDARRRTDHYGRDPQQTRARAHAVALADLTAKDTDVLLPKQTLTMAARKAFQLFTNPFDGEVTDDAQMFANGEIAYVREACLQAATGGRFVAIVAESGGGKTTIQADLEARIERDRKTVIVIKPSVVGMEDNDSRGKTLKSADILAAIITTLDALATVPQTLEARAKKVAKLLSASIEAGFAHLLVIEEAHCLPEATLKHLKRLHELRHGRKPMLGILLLAQPELALKLDPRRASLREVTQRCEVVHLLPLDADLKPYLEHRAKAAGRSLDEFLDDGGVEEIRARLTIKRPAANGKASATSLLYPLAVNNLMTAALNVAAELGAPRVGRDVVRAV